MSREGAADMMPVPGVGGPAPPSPRLPNNQTPPSPRDTTCRAALLGLTGVGKTALTVRLLTKRFIGEYCPTLESMYCYHETIDSEDIRIEIFDTAGITPDDPFPETYALWGNCFLLVYAINDRRSFDGIARVKRALDVLKGGEGPPCVLVGNKSDLEYERRVRRHEGQRLARILGCTHFFETSACDGNHVAHIADMFHTMYHDFRKYRAAHFGDPDNRGSGANGTGSRNKATSAKFKNAIQKVMNRSKANSPKHSVTKMGPSRESVV